MTSADKNGQSSRQASKQPTPQKSEPQTAQERARLEAGRILFARPVTFMLSVVKMATLPPPDLPEICFAGRSNVGKSSLINAITNQNKLAKASNTPGRTRELNYFNVSDRLRIVDLPGYGYARASKTDIEKWTKLTRQFLAGRAPLRRIFLLIDSRRGVKDSDLEIMSLLDEVAVTYQIVLTKTDKIKKGEVDKVLEKTQSKIARRPAAHPHILLTSSEKNLGVEEIRAQIAALALPQSGL